MTSASLYRWSGLALYFGAIVAIIGNVLSSVLFPGNAPPPSQISLSTALAVLGFIGQMLMLAGISGLAARQVWEAGAMGFAGFVLTFFGGFLLTGFSVVVVLIFPWLAQAAPSVASLPPPPGFFLYTLIGNTLFGVGGLLLGISTMRAGVFPRTAGVLLVIGAILGAAAFPLQGILSTILGTASFVIFAVGVGWIGSVMMRESRTAVAEARVV